MNRPGDTHGGVPLEPMVREALAARDQRMIAPRFAPGAGAAPRPASTRRFMLPIAAAAAGIAAFAMLIVTRTPTVPLAAFTPDSLALVSAEQLWHAPTDTLLQLAAAPSSIELPGIDRLETLPKELFL